MDVTVVFNIIYREVKSFIRPINTLFSPVTGEILNRSSVPHRANTHRRIPHTLTLAPTGGYSISPTGHVFRLWAKKLDKAEDAYPSMLWARGRVHRRQAASDIMREN